MNKYGLAALKAVNYYKIKKDPIEAWEAAVKDIFETKSSREKGCPKSTFLSICEIGVVKNIPKGNYAPTVKENKIYALKAIEILEKNKKQPSLFSEKELWSKVQDINKSYNSQMDVVLALWNNGLII